MTRLVGQTPTDRWAKFLQQNGDQAGFDNLGKTHILGPVVTTKETCVFTVEDSPVFVSTIGEMLSGIPGVSMTGSAAEAGLAVQEIQRLAPDIIILDLHLKIGTGIDVLRALRRGAATPPVSIIFSSCLDASCRKVCRRHGADFIVDKSENYSQLAEVIRSIATGFDGGGLPAGQARRRIESDDDSRTISKIILAAGGCPGTRADARRAADA